jgi:hypothetical protein
MNLDDIDFEQEWKKFKEAIGSNLFVTSFYISDFVCIYFDDQYGDVAYEKAKHEVLGKVFKIWEQLGLVVDCKNKLDHPRHQINQHCSMSNLSIQHDEESSKK